MCEKPLFEFSFRFGAQKSPSTHYLTYRDTSMEDKLSEIMAILSFREIIDLASIFVNYRPAHHAGPTFRCNLDRCSSNPYL